jgi:hypothetical protein
MDIQNLNNVFHYDIIKLSMLTETHFSGLNQLEALWEKKDVTMDFVEI